MVYHKCKVRILELTLMKGFFIQNLFSCFSVASQGTTKMVYYRQFLTNKMLSEGLETNVLTCSYVETSPLICRFYIIATLG